MTRRGGRRRKKLLDDLKERRGHSHLKEEALDRTMWRARFGRGFGPIVRQTTKWKNGQRFFSSCTRPDRSLVPPVSYSMDTGDLPPLVKLPGAWSWLIYLAPRLRMNGTKLLFLLHAFVPGQVKFTSFSSYYFPSFLVMYLLLSPPGLSRHYYLAQRYTLICPISSHSINIVAITKLYVSRPKNEFKPP